MDRATKGIHRVPDMTKKQFDATIDLLQTLWKIDIAEAEWTVYGDDQFMIHIVKMRSEDRRHRILARYAGVMR